VFGTYGLGCAAMQRTRVILRAHKEQNFLLATVSQKKTSRVYHSQLRLEHHSEKVCQRICANKIISPSSIYCSRRLVQIPIREGIF
jgi:hypothetical protein